MDAEPFGQDGVNVDLALVEGERLAVGRGGCDLGRGVETKNGAASGHAFQNRIEVSRVAAAGADRLAAATAYAFAFDRGGLGRFLRPLPGGPCFAFDAVEFLEFEVFGFVEVADGRFAPQLADGAEIGGHRRLWNGEVLTDCDLGPTLDVQVGHSVAPEQDFVFFRLGNRHVWGFLQL
jgi:hypothetical protein